ncbi:MAG: preprotein translocase subunit YajC [Firmicutes bacterium]|nr:preprotein translocase subunit YajC [Bacillota bacterium]
MLELLNFFDGTTDTNPNDTGTPWWMWLIFGVIIVGMILMMVIPQRKQKKRNEEMMARLGIGSIVTTIGGIVGEVVQLDDAHIWILTGVGDNKATMQFIRQAIHSIAPAPGTPEAIAAEQAEKEKAEEVDEIK